MTISYAVLCMVVGFGSAYFYDQIVGIPSPYYLIAAVVTTVIVCFYTEGDSPNA